MSDGLYGVLQDELTKLREQLRLAVEALEIYADRENWNCADIANLTGSYYSVYEGDHKQDCAYELGEEALDKIKDMEKVG